MKGETLESKPESVADAENFDELYAALEAEGRGDIVPEIEAFRHDDSLKFKSVIAETAGLAKVKKWGGEVINKVSELLEKEENEKGVGVEE